MAAPQDAPVGASGGAPEEDAAGEGSGTAAPTPTRGVTRRVRRRPGPAWWAALLAVPVLLTAVVGLVTGPGLEHELEDRALRSLDRAGLGSVRVALDGRQATVYLPTGSSQRRATAAVVRVEGVGDVDVVPVAASVREERACDGLPARVARATDGGRIPFVGETPTLTGEGAAMVRAAARLLRACPRGLVTAGGHTDGSTHGGSTLTLRRAEVLKRLLVEGGVRAARVRARGFAASYELSAADTSAADALNQRGSIVVVGP